MVIARYKPYDALNVNEMAYAVYNAAVKPSLRKDVEKLYGSTLSQAWYKFNELSMELKKYYKPISSTRKEIVTTLDKIYGYDIPMKLNFFETKSEKGQDESASKKDYDKEESISPSGPATQSCDAEKSGSDPTVYDSDWLYVR